MKVIEKEALFEMKQPKAELINDNFQNYKRYGIPKAQLVIADIPYNIGRNFYGSNPVWYNKGDNKNGESRFAGKAHLIRISISILQNIFISATSC